MIGRNSVGSDLRAKQLRSRLLAVGSLVGAAFGFSPQLRATSVVALMDSVHQRVVIAADCRVNRELSPVSSCKIIEEPNCIAAIAGLYEEKSTDFQLRALVHAACQEPGDLRAKAEAFLRISRKPFERAIRAIRDEQPTEYASPISNKQTEVIFAGIQDGQVGLIVRGLIANPVGKIELERLESTAPTYPRIGYFVGLNGHIRAYIKAHPNWLRDDYTQLAPRLVELEIQAHPDLAGLPISLVEIDGDGNAKWLSLGACVKRRQDEQMWIRGSSK